MDRFEQSFENLDVQSQVMEGTMCNTSTLTTPQGEVDNLMQEVADEAGWVPALVLLVRVGIKLGNVGNIQSLHSHNREVKIFIIAWLDRVGSPKLVLLDGVGVKLGTV